MIKKLLYLILLFAGAMQGQIINIPDPDFKAVLLNATAENTIARDNNLNYIVIDSNNNSEIEVSEAALVYHLLLGASNISSVAGIESFTNLQTLDCSSNAVTSLDVSGMPALKDLTCSNNMLTALNLEGLSNLQYLNCGNNQISNLTLTGCTQLITVDCSYNQLATLNVSGFTNLTSLTCNDNIIATLDVSGMPLLDYLDCDNNQLSELNLTDSPGFTFISCSGNQLSALDASDNNAAMIDCSNNQLTKLIIKNGFDNSNDFIQFHDNPGLLYLCVDQEELEAYQDIIQLYGYANCAIGPYCTFTPGGNFNNITGTLTVDANNNGCEASDVRQSFIKMAINDGSTNEATFTNASGQYDFYTTSGMFTIAPELENDFFTVSPVSSSVNFPDADNSIATANFCLLPNGIHKDVEVVMVPIIPANPGFEAVYKIVYRNKGNQVLSGSVTCTWDYTKFNDVNLVPVPDNQNSGSYTWNYTNLLPFENREIIMNLGVNSPSASVPVNAGDIIDFTAVATLAGTDETPEDNEFVLNQEVVGSFDPNNISCIEGETASPEHIGDYLHYVVNFENTGTAAATFIVVTHQIDPAEFDINTLQVLNASHNVAARIKGNTIEFIFNNINLAASDHGNILFKLKSRNNLHPGDNIMNQANIFFDYNFPVVTNEATTTFENLAVADFEVDASIELYPNPSKGLINVKAQTPIETVSIYDVQGRLLHVSVINHTDAQLDISLRATGIYIIRVQTKQGVKVIRIVKD